MKIANSPGMQTLFYIVGIIDIFFGSDVVANSDVHWAMHRFRIVPANTGIPVTRGLCDIRATVPGR